MDPKDTAEVKLDGATVDPEVLAGFARMPTECHPTSDTAYCEAIHDEMNRMCESDR